MLTESDRFGGLPGSYRPGRMFLMTYSRPRMFVAAIFLASLLSAPAYGHLVSGRRPIDYFARNADVVLVAQVKDPTSGRKQGMRTTFHPKQCLKGPCPTEVFATAPVDDHAATFSTGQIVLLGLRKGPSKSAPDWLVIQNAWEVAMDAPYIAKAASYVPRYAALESHPEDTRVEAYLNLLLEQAGDENPSLQDDAVQSLLRFPSAHVGAEEARRLAGIAARATRDVNQVALLAIAQSWDQDAVRTFASTHDLLEDAAPRAKARLIALFGKGGAAARAQVCRYVDGGAPQVRAAAIRYCRLESADATWERLYPVLRSENPVVKTAARKRFGDDPTARAWLAARLRESLPAWKRWYYSALGKEPPAVREILTD